VAEGESPEFKPPVLQKKKEKLTIKRSRKKYIL
jgi:hypothetical protein